MSTDPARPTEPPRPDPPFSTFELLLLATFAALIVAANVALKLPLKLPGHSGLVWMALLVRRGASCPSPAPPPRCGLLSGAVAVFLGPRDKGALDTLLSYAAAGAGVDAHLLAGSRPGRVACAVAGLAGNLAKLAVKIRSKYGWGFPLASCWSGGCSRR